MSPQTAAQRLERVRSFYRPGRPDDGRAWHWNELPQVRARIHRLVTGDAAVEPTRALLAWLPELGLSVPVERCAVLGCGRGRRERTLARLGVARHVEGHDLSPDSLRDARRLAGGAGLERIAYVETDLDRVELPTAAYDLVVGEMSFHHVTALERLYAQVHRALRPGGLLVLDEYVGPSRFRWTERQLAILNGLLAVLPAERLATYEGTSKPPVEHMPEAWFEQVDPSEAIRSAEILPLLEQRFAVVLLRPYGGTLLHPLLSGIAFHFRDTLGEAFLEAVFELEDAFLAGGDLAHDFVYLVARPR